MPLYQGIPQKHMEGINIVTKDHGAHYPMSVSTPDACSEADTIAIHFHKSFPEIKTVVDIGCCGGHLVLSLLKQGVFAFGVDAHIDAPPCLGAPILLRDATIELDILPKADAVICWEMAEHVPIEKANILITNLCQISDNIFFSAGIPGYEGAHGHQNCQTPKYWEEKFQLHGYSSIESFQIWKDSLRKTIESIQGQSYLWWSWSDQSRLYKKVR